MSAAFTTLLLAALFFPVGSILLLRVVSQPTAIPDDVDLVLFGGALPALAFVMFALTARAMDVLSKRIYFGLAAWFSFIGWCHVQLIYGIWASI